eukprot:m.191129 g.191129  ORF g.191129 m.191129 type:complete len:752 (+) comp25703_c0_seq2:902-3157(+)
MQYGMGATSLVTTEALYQGVTGIWSLPCSAGETMHRYVVISFAMVTRVLLCESQPEASQTEQDQEETLAIDDFSEQSGLQLDVPSLSVGVDSWGRLVQICNKDVGISDPGHPDSQARWQAPSLISIGSVLHDQVLLCHPEGNQIAILELKPPSEVRSGSFLVLKTSLSLPCEISCVLFLPATQPSASSSSSRTMSSSLILSSSSAITHRVLCGTYDCKIYVLAATATSLQIQQECNLENISKEGINIPESLRIARVTTTDQLFVGLRDGTVASFAWSDSGTEDCIGPCSSAIQIGVAPVKLVEGYDGGLLALSDRPRMIHALHGRTSFTPLVFPLTAYAVPFRFPGLGRAFLLIANDAIHIVAADNSTTISLTEVLEGHLNRFLVFHPTSHLLVACTTGRTGQATVSLIDPNAQMKLVDERTFPQHTTFEACAVCHDKICLATGGEELLFLEVVQLENGYELQLHSRFASQTALTSLAPFGEDCIITANKDTLTLWNCSEVVKSRRRLATQELESCILKLKVVSDFVLAATAQDGLLVYQGQELTLAHADPFSRCVVDVEVINDRMFLCVTEHGAVYVLAISEAEGKPPFASVTLQEIACIDINECCRSVSLASLAPYLHKRANTKARAPILATHDGSLLSASLLEPYNGQWLACIQRALVSAEANIASCRSLLGGDFFVHLSQHSSCHHCLYGAVLKEFGHLSSNSQLEVVEHAQRIAAASHQTPFEPEATVAQLLLRTTELLQRVLVPL